MYVIRRSTNSIWPFQTGYYRPNGVWDLDDLFATKDAAVQRVHYLNGGPRRDCCDSDATLERIRRLLGP